MEAKYIYLVEKRELLVELHERVDVGLKDGDIGLEEGLSVGLHDREERLFVHDRCFRRLCAERLAGGGGEEVAPVVQKQAGQKAVQGDFDVGSGFLEFESNDRIVF